MKDLKVVSILLYSFAFFGMNAAYAGDKLESRFLDCLERERVPVSIFLVNGIKLQGQIGDHSENVILLKNSVDQMVYRHAISTVVPARNVGSTCLDAQDDDD